MILVEFVEGSRSQLCLKVNNSAGPQSGVDLSRASELLFSVLQGTSSLPVAPIADANQIVAGASTEQTSERPTVESFLPIAIVRRMRNPLYSMFGANRASVA